MRRDPNDESGEIIVYIGGLLVIVMLGFLSIKVMQDRQQECQLHGEVYHFDRNGGKCSKANPATADLANTSIP